ncbi:MAG: hypothetical protein Fues2KO_16060 [Fuerstiella sp.]
MRTHTLLTRVTSVAVCLGIMLSGPVAFGAEGIIKDIELTQDGKLYGQVFTPQGKTVPEAVVQLRYKGAAVAAAKSNHQGQFVITGVRGGAHEVVVGPLRQPVRLWAQGSAPRSATKGMVVAIDETIVRGQDVYCEPGASTAGFGMLDVITLATVGAAVGSLVVAIDNNNELEDIKAALPPASP